MPGGQNVTSSSSVILSCPLIIFIETDANSRKSVQIETKFIGPTLYRTGSDNNSNKIFSNRYWLIQTLKWQWYGTVRTRILSENVLRKESNCYTSCSSGSCSCSCSCSRSCSCYCSSCSSCSSCSCSSSCSCYSSCSCSSPSSSFSSSSASSSSSFTTISSSNVY